MFVAEPVTSRNSRTSFHRCNHCGSHACHNQKDTKMFTNAPSLTHVELICLPWGWGLDWSSLTQLRLPVMRCEDSMILCLQQAVNLNTLTTGIVPDSFNISERITLPRLESWQVLDYFWLRCFKAPALQNLCLHGHRAIQINAIVSTRVRL